MLRYIYVLFFLLLSTVLWAQPPNDFCSGAFPVTPNNTCYGPGLPETTTAGASDAWTGPAIGCTANANEVWFSFVATSTVVNLNVTSGTLGGNIQVIIVSSTGPCTGLALSTTPSSICQASPISETITGLVIGTTYYYTVSGTGTDGTFTTCVESVTAPPNDLCSGVFPITPDGTCYGPGLPQTTTTYAADDVVGTVGCNGNNNEVWFSFVATNSQLNVNFTSGTLGGDIEFALMSSATPPCAGITYISALCSPSPLTGTVNGLQIGTTYYYTISSTGADGTFTACVDNVAPTPVSGQDCAAAAILCDASDFSQGTSSAGFGNQEITTGNSCWGSGGERQSKWFKFTSSCGGTLEFSILPVTNSNDYDWALFDITGDPTGCTTMGNSIACNWSGCKGSTGITTCPDPSSEEPQTVSSGAGCFGGPAAWEITTVTLTAGSSYALLVDNFSTTNDGFSLVFGGACGGGTTDLGPDAAFTGGLDASCMAFTGVKTCPTANSTYLWNYGDGTTSTGMNGSHTYSTIGTYTVSYQVTDALGCTRTTSLLLDVGCVLLSSKLTSFEGSSDEKYNLLTWEMVNTPELDFFTVQRSKDGISWTNIGEVEGHEATSNNTSYELKDHNYLLSKESYYRLKMHDKDGSVSFSDIIVIERNLTAVGGLYIHAIYPVPVKNELILEIESSASQNTTIKFFDMLGHLVHEENMQLEASLNKLTIDMARFDKGVYMLQIQDNTNKATQLKKIIKI